MKKMYILVRQDLSPSQQAVQACHAVADYLLHYGEDLEPPEDWNNGTMVLLKVKDHKELLDWAKQLKAYRHQYAVFLETDLESNQETALCCIPDDNSIFETLDLL